ncbi:unnamed protein product [Musa acuminata var. zebrina]
MPNCVNPNLAKSRLPPTGLHAQFCRCYLAEEQVEGNHRCYKEQLYFQA